MNNRELLELAARAAGMQINKQRQAERDAIVDPATASLWIVDGCTAWNSLTEDGHALRLAVSTGLHKRLHEILTGPAYRADALSYGEQCATRRAITRAAAEIGKSMGGGE